MKAIFSGATCIWVIAYALHLGRLPPYHPTSFRSLYLDSRRCGVAGAERKERSKERMKGWVDEMPSTHIYLLAGQRVCWVIALYLARQQMKEALWKDRSDCSHVASFTNSCTLKSFSKFSGVNSQIFFLLGDINQTNVNWFPKEECWKLTIWADWTDHFIKKINNCYIIVKFHRIIIIVSCHFLRISHENDCYLPITFCIIFLKI